MAVGASMLAWPHSSLLCTCSTSAVELGLLVFKSLLSSAAALMDLFPLYHPNPFWNLLILVSPTVSLGSTRYSLVLLSYLSIVKSKLFVEKLVVWSQVWSAEQLQWQDSVMVVMWCSFLGCVGRWIFWKCWTSGLPAPAWLQALDLYFGYL